MAPDPISEIAALFSRSKAEKRGVAVFWGAGCSVNAGIPSCKEIIEEVKKGYPAEYKKARSNKYVDVMAEVPIDDRRDLIGKWVSEARVNWAHIALAHLIENDYVSRVLSTNFDPLLEHACSLVGCRRLAVYDLPATSEAVFRDRLIESPALIYLHGRHSGFVQANTEAETSNNPLAKEVIASCDEYPWLVIGYSGENDPLLPLIEKRVPFPRRRFWIHRYPTPPAHLTSVLYPRGGGAIPVQITDADEFMIELACRLGSFPWELLLNSDVRVCKELENFSIKNPPSGLDRVPRIAQALLRPSDGRRPAPNDALFLQALRLFYENSIEMLALSEDPSNQPILSKDLELADLVGKGCLKAGDQWRNSYAEIENPTESDRYRTDKAVQNYVRAQALSPSSSSLAVKRITSVENSILEETTGFTSPPESPFQAEI